MDIKRFDPTEPDYDAYIRTARTELLTTIKASVTEPGIRPLSFATYIGLFANHTINGAAIPASRPRCSGNYVS